MNILILGNMGDMQSGIYIMESCRNVSSNVSGIDTRKMFNELGPDGVHDMLMKELKVLPFYPNLILILKGLEMKLKTFEKLKEMYPKAILANWFFDKYLSDKPIWLRTDYFETIKVFDYYFCSLKGVADKLKEIGFENAIYLDEGCCPLFNGEAYINHFQQKKYGADVAFIGSLGYNLQHPNRIPILDIIAREGFNFKVWGNVVCDSKQLPLALKECLTNMEVINDKHSLVCQSSLINIGIDQDLTIDKGYSARLYRTMCAGGLYMSTDTKGLRSVFKANLQDAELTGDEEMVIFSGDEELIKKLDFLLEHDDIREKIAKNGQKTVLANHTFEHRIKEIIEVIKNDKKSFKFSN